MSSSKANIIAQLQREILPLQGYKSVVKTNGFSSGLGPIKQSFPGAEFPLGAMHEFFCGGEEDLSTTTAFISGILSSLVQKAGVLLWIGSGLVFPPSLKMFGLQPENVLFLSTNNQKEKLWAMEEALKCDSLSAVISEIPEVSFTASRRLQLAVEQSRVTGFVIRRNPKNLITACVARWRITSLAAEPGDMPGVGFPRWNVELLKVRNGRPGVWKVEWADGRFKHAYILAAITKDEHRKAV